MKNIKSRCTLLTISMSLCFSVFAQDNFIIKYFDSTWQVISKDSAYFFTEFRKVDTVYQCKSYWMKNKKLNCISTYKDTLFKTPWGILFRYYENGKIADTIKFYPSGEEEQEIHYFESGLLNSSISFARDSKITEAKYYYPDGKVWINYYTTDNGNITEAYDSIGKKLKNFIFFQDAECPSGTEKWEEYLMRNIKSKVPVKRGAPAGIYTVIVDFIISTEGEIADIKTETNFGYGMEDEAMRVIKNSPKWKPAIYLNRKSKAYRRQPITFIVKEKFHL